MFVYTNVTVSESEESDTDSDSEEEDALPSRPPTPLIHSHTKRFLPNHPQAVWPITASFSTPSTYHRPKMVTTSASSTRASQTGRYFPPPISNEKLVKKCMILGKLEECFEFDGPSNDWDRRPRCFLCTSSEHLSRHCPSRPCNRCLSQDHISSQCHLVAPSTTCSICRLRGHRKSECPDLWRRYHITTGDNETGSDPLPVRPKIQSGALRSFKSCPNHGGLGCWLADDDVKHHRAKHIFSYQTPIPSERDIERVGQRSQEKSNGKSRRIEKRRRKNDAPQNQAWKEQGVGNRKRKRVERNGWEEYEDERGGKKRRGDRWKEEKTPRKNKRWQKEKEQGDQSWRGFNHNKSVKYEADDLFKITIRSRSSSQSRNNPKPLGKERDGNNINIPKHKYNYFKHLKNKKWQTKGENRNNKWKNSYNRISVT